MFGNTNNSPFTMPVIPAGYGSNAGFGGNEGWGWGWIWILLIFAVFGWGGNGFSGFGGNNSSVAEGYVLSNDFSNLSRQISEGFGTQESKLDSISNGICSLGYDQLAQMNGINQNVTNAGYNIERAIQADTIANMQNQFGLQQAINDAKINCTNNYRGISEQLAQCCCDNEKATMQTRYDMATQNCGTLQAIDKLGDRIIDRINQSENAAKDAKIAEQACVINNQYLLSQINRTPVPAYVVQNPYCQCNNGYPYGFFNGTTVA